MTVINILYGSQTGNAEDLAKRIGLQAKQRGHHVLVQIMDEFPLKMLPKQRVVIFVCSTTGHGQEPENMKNLYNFMRRRDLPQDCLSRLSYAVFGLGDSSYSKFNYVSKILFKRIRDCGGSPIIDLAAGDEQHPLGCDGIFYPKLTELWSRLSTDLSVEASPFEPVGSPILESSYDLEFYETDDDHIPVGNFTEEFVDRYDLKSAYCIKNDRVTSDDHFQDTRFICLKSIDDIHYQPGDVCSILPANSDADVSTFIETLGLNPDSRFKLRKKDSNYMVNYLYDFVPDGLKIESLVKYYLDIQSVPRRSFFEFLWPLSDDELERGKLKEFASTEGQEEMYEYCTQPKRSILEVLIDFPNTVKSIKPAYLFDLVPPIKPRSFSIASSSLRHPNEIHLIVGVVRYQTRLRKTRKGLCSNYLAGLKPGDALDVASEVGKLNFCIKQTAFKLPADANQSIIMIGPGLGIAPFRSFIEERQVEQECTKAANHLYFGCRFREADYYFRDELELYEANGSIVLRVAFSRQEPKRYVQDLIALDSELVKRLIMKENATIYVAGNSKLPENLRKLFASILVTDDGDKSAQAERLVTELEIQNRIQYDCW